MAKQNKQVDSICDKTAEQVDLKTELSGPISELSKLRRSLLFAEISLVSYMKPEQFDKAARRLGFQNTKYFDRDGSQAYWLTNEHDSVIACRGTEANEWNDIKADLHAVFSLAETVGHVHTGFKKEVDDLWPMIEKAIVNDRKDLWFTGHSLGGAMASICAGRCLLSHIQNEPKEIYTYGSPRIGNKRYVNYSKTPHIRWVNNNDLVPTVPPAWFGYRHTGEEHYITHKGEVKMLRGWRRMRDKLKGFFKGLLKFRLDQFTDHLMPYYIEAIYREAKRQETKRQEPKS